MGLSPGSNRVAKEVKAFSWRPPRKQNDFATYGSVFPVHSEVGGVQDYSHLVWIGTWCQRGNHFAEAVRRLTTRLKSEPRSVVVCERSLESLVVQQTEEWAVGRLM